MAKQKAKGRNTSSPPKGRKKSHTNFITRRLVGEERVCDCEEIPTLPTGVAGIVIRNQAGELDIVALPNAEKYVKSDGNGGIIFTNT